MRGLFICCTGVVTGILIGILFIPFYGEMSLGVGMVVGFIGSLIVERRVKKRGWIASGKRQYEERKKDKKADRIKPCKKCGSNYIVTLARSNYYFEGPGASLDHILECTECGHTSKTFDNTTKAYADWNGVKKKKRLTLSEFVNKRVGENMSITWGLGGDTNGRIARWTAEATIDYLEKYGRKYGRKYV